MNSQDNQTSYSGGPGAAFSFDRRQNGMRFSADLGRLCQQVSEQVRNAVAEVDFENLDDLAVRKIFVGATRATMKLIVVASASAAAALAERGVS